MRRINKLHGLRGLASLWILLFHYLPYYYVIFGFNESILDRPIRWGFLAVDFFFYLSGFILAYVYEETFRNKFSFSKIKFFYWKRFIRIYPLYLLTTVIALMFWLIALKANHSFRNEDPNSFTSGSVVLNIFGVQQWFGRMSLNGPSWSLSVEFLMYFLFPFFIFVINKYIKQSVVLMISIILLSQLVLVFLHNIINNFNLLRGMFEFPIGILLYFVSMKFKSNTQVIPWFGISALILCLTFIDPEQKVYGHFFAIFFLLIILISFKEDCKGVGNKYFTTLGTWSFSLYLTHRLLQNILSALNYPRHYENILINISQGIFLLIAPIALSAFVTQKFEIPMTKYLLMRR